MLRRYSLVPLVLSVGCHNDSHSAPPDTPDDTHAITIDSEGTTYIYLAVRDGDGPWTKLDPTATSIHVHDDYQLIAACGDTSFESTIQSSTVADGDTVELPCIGLVGGGAVPIFISGTMVQAGTVAINASVSSTTPNWAFSLEVDPGPHALLAFGGGKAIVERGLDFEANTTIPDVDTSTGVAAPSTTYRLDNLTDGADPSANVTAFIGPDFMFLPDSPTLTVQTVPPSLLQPGEDQHVHLQGVTPRGTQFASVNPATTSATVIPMLPSIAGIVTFADGKAAWIANLPDGDAELDAFGGNAFTHIQATSSWLAAKSSLAIDTHDVPGFLPEWRADTSPANLSFSVSAMSGNVFVLTDAFPAATSVARDARSFRAHRRSLDRSRDR